MDSNISYTDEQDTLEKEQTNTIPEQTIEPEVDNSLGSNQEEDIYLGMTDEEFLKSNVEAPTAYQEPTSQPEPINKFLLIPKHQRILILLVQR